MTPLPHNPAITVIDLPEDAKQVELNGRCLYYRRNGWLSLIHLPLATYKLICLGLQATEEEAREILEEWHLNEKYETYYYKDYLIETEGYCEDAVKSLSTLIASNGWKNPVFVLQVNY